MRFICRAVGVGKVHRYFECLLNDFINREFGPVVRGNGLQ